MKNSIFFIVIVLSFFSCSSTEEQTDISQITDIEELKKVKKTLLAEKKSIEKNLSLIENKLSDGVSYSKTKVVQIGKVLSGEFNHYVQLQGAVKAEDMVYVSSETGGRIIRTYIKEGEYVSKGKLIASIDAQSIKDQIEEVRTSLSLAQTVYEKQKRLWDQNIGSEIQYLQAKNNKESIEQRLNTMSQQLKKANIYAPISGEVFVKMAKDGEVVGPGTPICQILNTSKVEVEVDVPESLIGKIKRGDYVDIEFPALQDTVRAKIKYIGSVIDQNNRTFKVEIPLNNVKKTFKPNLLAMVKVNDFSTKEALSIPTEIIMQDVSQKDYVMVADSVAGQVIAKKRMITTGEDYEGKTLVTSGLNADDRIITYGARELADNEKVIIAE